MSVYHVFVLMKKIYIDYSSTVLLVLLKVDDDEDDEDAPRVWSGGGRRRIRHPEVRRQIQTEDEDHINLPSPLGSQSSSADGIYPSGRTCHPFRVVEHDAASVQSSISLGKVSFLSFYIKVMRWVLIFFYLYTIIMHFFFILFQVVCTIVMYSLFFLFQVGKILGGLESHIIQENQQSQEIQTQPETKSMESSHSDPSKDIRPSGNVILASK